MSGLEIAFVAASLRNLVAASGSGGFAVTDIC
jgi:hypothetical protein